MFGFLKRSDNNGAQLPPLNGHNPNSGPALPEVEERVFIESAAPTVQTRTDNHVEHNIGVLYAFMDRNHEVKGYDDALLNPDASNLSQNLDALKSDLIRTLNKVKTFYDDFIQETEFHILSRSRSGMVDMVEELEMKKKIAQGHIEKVKVIEEDTARDEGDCKGILISYTRGFKNGLAAISHHHILSRRF
ncbi:hypothetical protein HDF24_25165 [Mucilaginibacter sp. X4EP1]|uniref:hypothetical protein n=1 Tax=Mucilaginibacter sp. X4EP1 TaxID=2723092 RepID=UPI002167303D|nr:hypothetical protein [Mucilaginibacter sp. X4EP1]MCS3815098.1 diadenosine tetraphosphate (Ap4A) HIT family hydrolase [Mucilaginibacter sp. X4EP1]